MGSEYLFFSPFEYKETKKSLLNSELSALNSMESLHKFKQFRLEELNSKVKLKTLLQQAMEELTLLEKMMPQTRFNQEKVHKTQTTELTEGSPVKQEEELKRDSNIQSQLQDIKRKLALLQ